MIAVKEYEIPSCDDVELGLKRESLLSFKLCYDDEKAIQALVFIVPGLGEDASAKYREHLAEFVASHYDVAVVNVDYHCIGNRPQSGSKFIMDWLDKQILIQQCNKLGIKLDGDMSMFDDFYMMSKFLTDFDICIDNCKQGGALAQDYRMPISLTVAPTKGEYQNYGIMQAQDLINALLFVKANVNFKLAKGNKAQNLPCVMIGSSHGGYLALMAAKIAPWLVDAVVDNSGYTIVPWRLIGFGKEIDYTQYCCFATDVFYNNIKIYCSDKTLWTLDKSSPNFFHQACEDIRNPLNKEHLNTQSKTIKPFYASYHCGVDDFIAPPKDKIEFYDELKKLGFDATLHLITDESEVDGRFIKNLKHGLGMSIKILIQKELPLMLDKISKRKKSANIQKSIEYVSDDRIYKFSQKNDKIKLEILK